MRGNPQEEVGKVYGRLTVVALAPLDKQKRRRYLCRCVCGSVKPYDWHSIKSTRKYQSCGCLRYSLIREKVTKHGEARVRNGTVTTEYRTWTHIIGRCENQNDTAWPNYGGRGIAICREWRESFQAFLAHVGRRPAPGFSIDRVDNDGNYEPGNVRWATKSQQALNRRPRRKKGAA